MKGKILDLFGDGAQIIENTKYSELLDQFTSAFEAEIKKMEFGDMEDIFDISVASWNAANLILLIPKKDRKKAYNAIKDDSEDSRLMRSMMDYKIKNFPNDLNFFTDYEIAESDTGLTLTVTTLTPEDYIQSVDDMPKGLQNDEDSENASFEFDENFVNRTAVILTAREPFIAWFQKVAPDMDVDMVAKNAVFLINDDLKDISAWVQKKFEKFFSHQLSFGTMDKKQWPSKRSYKMFKEWFTFEISEIVYDFEKRPVRKS